MEETFSSDDMAIEVLSRLPAKTLAACKCVSKRWNSLISRPSILRAHFERSQDLSGIFFQHYRENLDHINSPITYVTLDGKQPPRVITNFLDFLPEKVVLFGSCNGLLCCRSCIYPHRFGETAGPAKDLLIYICNPHSKEWIAFIPKKSQVNDAFGLAFYPFGSSLNPDPCFKLVSVHHPREHSRVYHFSVYSSETGKWKRIKGSCRRLFSIRKNMVIFVGSRFHWLTNGPFVMTFDIERELSAHIRLPDPVMQYHGWGSCLGGSGGCLHYVCAHVSEVRVWMLIDYGKSEWILKYNLNISDFIKEHKKHFDEFLLKRLDSVKLQGETAPNYSLFPNYRFFPLAYSEEVLYMKVERRLFSYDCSTTELNVGGWLDGVERYITPNVFLPTVLPHTVCMAAVGVLKGQHLGRKKNAKGSVDSSSGPKQKRRKRN